jgi:hypothetical protein
MKMQMKITVVEKFGRALSAAIHKASINNINELYIVANSDYISDLSYF